MNQRFPANERLVSVEARRLNVVNQPDPYRHRHKNTTKKPQKSPRVRPRLNLIVVRSSLMTKDIESAKCVFRSNLTKVSKEAPKLVLFRNDVFEKIDIIEQQV